MNTNSKHVLVVHSLALAIGVILSAMAGRASAQAATSPVAEDATECAQDACKSNEGMLFQVRSYGEGKPAVVGDDPEALRRNRRVELVSVQKSMGVVSSQNGGTARIAGEFSMDLPNGGLIFATEDPTLGRPVLNVQAGSTVPLRDGRISRSVRFHGYNNYSAFIQRMEVMVYRGNDSDLVSPLATIVLPVENVSYAEWDGSLPAGTSVQPGDQLIYIARAYGADGSFDETLQQTMQLVTQEDYDRGIQAIRNDVQRDLGQALGAQDAQASRISSGIYGESMLRIQNIPIHGSRIRIAGRDVPDGARLTINGKTFPVDLERKFVAEFLEPVGVHEFAIKLETPGVAPFEDVLQVNVTGKYMFLMALADVTLSNNNVSGNVEPLAGDEQFDEGFISEARLAFFLKGKIKGKYLITAQADTQDRDVKRLFNGFLQADARDVFRRLDPDLYYPVYGDDSTTYRDVDTQGRLYLRVDWDKSQALWGNFATGVTGTEYGQYNRMLYGAALNWRSRATTALGDPRALLKAFGSEAQTALGHSEFLGTGGSLYYLRHTDVLPGSARVVLEVRDISTGRTEASVNMQQGVDYEIDELQGRLILTRPLAQITQENVRTLTRDTPLDGYEQRLLVDYEFQPVGFSTDDISAGVRGRYWFGDHFALGGTYIDENRSGDDYSLKAIDLVLQAGRGTYLKVEHATTQATVAPIFFSDNGGLSFIQRNPVTGSREGSATSVEGRVNFKELGWTQRDWSAGAWWRDVDAGFSMARSDTGADIREYGVEFLGYFSERFSVYGRFSRAERGGESLEQTQLTAEWNISDVARLGLELRRVREEHVSSDANALLTALSYRQRIGSKLELYGIGQLSSNEGSSAYAKNNLLTLGAKYQFGDRSSVGAEISDGSRGHGARVNAEYRFSPDHTLYGAFNYSTDNTERDPLFNHSLQSGWTIGQRWRINNQVNVYNESQYLTDSKADTSGIAHTFGMDFYPATGWNVGFTLMDGQLESASGQVDRHAFSISGGHTNPRTQWSSKLEYREDSGAEDREQWVTTNRLFYKVNEDWRIAARINYADTRDNINPAAGAKLAEANVGFAWRPHDNTRWAVFGKYTYLYDLATLGQLGGNQYDQRTQVLALEGVYQIDKNWEVAAKLASRSGDYRTGRGAGTWLDSRADFAAGQLRYRLIAKWEGLAEYRMLKVRDGGARHGFLVGLDREVGENFRIGVGYNFTDFSDDLTDLEYDNKGWFLNLSGRY